MKRDAGIRRYDSERKSAQPPKRNRRGCQKRLLPASSRYFSSPGPHQYYKFFENFLIAYASILFFDTVYPRVYFLNFRNILWYKGQGRKKNSPSWLSNVTMTGYFQSFLLVRVCCPDGARPLRELQDAFAFQPILHGFFGGRVDQKLAAFAVVD